MHIVVPQQIFIIAMGVQGLNQFIYSYTLVLEGII